VRAAIQLDLTRLSEEERAQYDALLDRLGAPRRVHQVRRKGRYSVAKLIEKHVL